MNEIKNKNDYFQLKKKNYKNEKPLVQKARVFKVFFNFLLVLEL